MFPHLLCNVHTKGEVFATAA